ERIVADTEVAVGPADDEAVGADADALAVAAAIVEDDEQGEGGALRGAKVRRLGRRRFRGGFGRGRARGSGRGQSGGQGRSLGLQGSVDVVVGFQAGRLVAGRAGGAFGGG